MSLSRRYVLLGVGALLALQFLWHGVLLRPERASGLLVALLLSLPLLPSLALFLARRPSAQFWAGVAALFYFCHGVTEAWTVAPARALALVEVALAVWVVVASSWEGLQARRAKRNKPASNV
jgi:uncharacterized membrane protein